MKSQFVKITRIDIQGKVQLRALDVGQNEEQSSEKSKIINWQPLRSSPQFQADEPIAKIKHGKVQYIDP